MTPHIPRHITYASALAVLALGVTGCSTSATTDAGEKTEKITVLHAAIAYEPLFLAQQEGYFEDAGLEVEIKSGGAPQDNLAQAVGGSADIVPVAWDTMVSSTAEGMTVSAVAGNSVVSDTVDTSGVVVRADSGIAELPDLKNKTIGLDSIGAGGSTELYAALDAEGVTADEVEVVAVPYASMAASLEQGHIDAAVPSEPFYSQLTGDEANTVISNPVRETRGGAPITLWAASNPWLDTNADAAAAFVEAMERGIQFYEDPANVEDVVNIRAEVTQVAADEVPRTLPDMRVAFDVAANSRAADQLLEFGPVEELEETLPVEEIIWSGAPVLEGSDDE